MQYQLEILQEKDQHELQKLVLNTHKKKKKLVAIHKANVLRFSDGLFLECAREVSKKYPDVEYKEQIVDSMSALIIRDPSVFDVILATNLFGDNLSDAASEIAGGLGLPSQLMLEIIIVLRKHNMDQHQILQEKIFPIQFHL